MTQLYGTVSMGSCTDASAAWTLQSMSDGSFKLVDKQMGSCLYANDLGNDVYTNVCSGMGRYVYWRTGSGNSVISVSNGGCLDLGSGVNVVTVTCRSGDSSQSWTRV